MLKSKALYWLEARRSSVTRARLKPSSKSHADTGKIVMDLTDMKNIAGAYETVAVSEDMSDIQVFLEHFDEIF